MYYFFDKRRGHSNNVMDAVRAMLAQLINQHKNVDDFRNLAIRIQGKSKDAQSQATSREIEDMLEELFRYLGPTFAVVDGVDECADYDNNFGRLSMIVSNDSNRLLLTGRPSVNLSSNIKWAAQVLHLGSENEADIKDFLLRELKKLMEAGLLHMDSTLDHMATLVSARANGMFLWVRLLIEYLNLPIWTIRERQDALFNLYRLEGLDALYTAILTSLHTLFPRKSHATLTRLFHLVVGARRPLTSRELSIAISVPLDRPHSPLDEIPNFTSSIGRLSGSLVEVTIQGTVQFVHLSLREFLTGALNSPDCDGVPGHIIASYCKEPDLTIASVCLSYLRHTLPARPLEGSSQITPAAFTVNNRHPFLSYSSIFWSDHLVVSLTMIKPRLAPFDKSVWELVSDLLLRFLDDKNRVTAWVEAAWLFATPHIKPWPVKTQLNLDPRLSAIPSLVAGVEKLYRLSEELLDLDQSWSHILMLEPNEIWEPSISTFKKSEFWVTTDQAKLVRLAPLVDNSSPSITVYSQIADSGTELGVIRLFPPW
ncbi:hypothetical protein H2198_004093 [Neophaeococcomyces mojaviensis]|uniref:Uncharacterized protein n=1 Tax=Neophaeococcomyces mojaviensis TaxID=3383035 RepID=A0ACC3A9U3_9EURO|nr:hypothetical protein H2198_004093 [Knufia sp. JES_112]